MPNYDYRCDQCEETVEIFQSMLDKPLEKCPECGSMAPVFRRLIGTGAGIVFKGSGFYETDYKKSSAPGSSSEKKTESKESKPTGDSGCCGGGCK